MVGKEKREKQKKPNGRGESQKHKTGNSYEEFKTLNHRILGGGERDHKEKKGKGTIIYPILHKSEGNGMVELTPSRYGQRKKVN